MRHLPNVLTVSRLALLPVLLVLLTIGTPGAVWVALALYILGAVTDYIDGWVARRYDLHSEMGQMLDPIADKIFVTAVILMLIAFGRIEGWWIFAPILILSREFLVSGLREYLGPKNIELPVTRLAKWKTGLQMTALGFLLTGPVGEAVCPATQEVGYSLLLIATGLTLVTGWQYLREGLKHVD